MRRVIEHISETEGTTLVLETFTHYGPIYVPYIQIGDTLERHVHMTSAKVSYFWTIPPLCTHLVHLSDQTSLNTATALIHNS